MLCKPIFSYIFRFYNYSMIFKLGFANELKNINGYHYRVVYSKICREQRHFLNYLLCLIF